MEESSSSEEEESPPPAKTPVNKKPAGFQKNPTKFNVNESDSDLDGGDENETCTLSEEESDIKRDKTYAAWFAKHEHELSPESWLSYVHCLFFRSRAFILNAHTISSYTHICEQTFVYCVCDVHLS